MVFLAFAGVDASLGRGSGRTAGTALLCVMAALKLVELRTHRDLVVLMLLMYLLLLTLCLRIQAIWSAAYLLLACVAITALLIECQRPGLLPPRQSLRRATLMVAQALLLMVLLFVSAPAGPAAVAPAGRPCRRHGAQRPVRDDGARRHRRADRVRRRGVPCALRSAATTGAALLARAGIGASRRPPSEPGSRPGAGLARRRRSAPTVPTRTVWCRATVRSCSASSSHASDSPICAMILALTLSLTLALSAYGFEQLRRAGADSGPRLARRPAAAAVSGGTAGGARSLPALPLSRSATAPPCSMPCAARWPARPVISAAPARGPAPAARRRSRRMAAG